MITFERHNLVPKGKAPDGMTQEEWAEAVTETAKMLLADVGCQHLLEVGLWFLPAGPYDGQAASVETFALWTGRDLDTVRRHLEHLSRRHYLERRYSWGADGRRVFDGFWLQVPDYLEDITRWRLEAGEEDVKATMELLRGIGKAVDEGETSPWPFWEAAFVLSDRQACIEELKEAK